MDMNAWLNSTENTVFEKLVLKFRPQTYRKSSRFGELIYFKPIWGGGGGLNRDWRLL